MKKYLYILLIIPVLSLAQVGINTTTPAAQLEIKSSNQATPANTDGILIPKIDAFPVVNPTAAQQGMLVYLTTTSGANQPGFYYWNNPGWVPIISGSAGGTLDQSYDFGGTGVGRTITADAGAVTINGTDGLVSTGISGSGAVAPTGAGVRMVWNPNKSAFRAGNVTGSQWNDANIGLNSVAFGLSTTASGPQSVALGNLSVASGNRSFAAGDATIASGIASTAFGSSSSAIGDQSIASGQGTIANGQASTSLGRNTIASGNSSLVSGFDSRAQSFGETVLGVGATNYTPSINGTTQWRAANSSDRLFVVGNAIDSNNNFLVDLSERSDAFVILKNGNTGIGSSTPSDKLHVVGNIRMVDGNQAAGKVFTSDANGTATWQTPAAAGTTLDGAYDFGGAGAGRTITADTGAVTIAGTDGLVSTGTIGSGATAPAGAGTRMVWNPRKAAFRAGNTSGIQWDDANVGQGSAAFGLSTTAKGNGSFAFGGSNIANGEVATAFGFQNTAQSFAETVLGIGATNYIPLQSNNFTAPTDRLLVVGNAIDANNNAFVDAAERSDALIILRSGLTRLPSTTNAIITAADGKAVVTKEYLAANTSGTLDQAYDFGGAGAGRTITADAGAVTINGTDGFISTGAIGSGALSPSITGTTIMMWYPRKAAFRAGSATFPNWEDFNIGLNSTAFGESTRASGSYSAAFGALTSAVGTSSTAFGNSTIAGGGFSTAFGNETNATGLVSTAFGNFNNASGDVSTAFGNSSAASGDISTAFGDSTSASGYGSTTFGGITTASGQFSTASGFLSAAPSFSETVIGIGATTYTPSLNGAAQFGAANATDRLFTIGNAIDINNNSYVDVTERSDALIILKNGNTGIGSSTPQDKLHVVGNIRMVDGNQAAGKVLTSDVNGTATWQNASANAWGLVGNAGTNPSTNFIGTTDSQPLTFRTNNTEKMRLLNGNLSNGLLAVGAPGVPASIFTNINQYSTIFSAGNGSSHGDITIATSGNSIFSSVWVSAKSRGTHTNPTIVQNGDQLDVKEAWGYDGSQYLISARIQTIVDGDPGNFDMPTAMTFSTTPDGSGGMQERMRLNNVGNLGIGTINPADRLHVVGNIRMVDGNQAAGKVLTSDVNGTGTWTAAGTLASGTLDQAYDFGGAGAGRTITADTGAVTITGTDGLVSTGTIGSGALAPSGAGTRMMWYPRKAAFRAGNIAGTQWDDVNIGSGSAAFGNSTIASGNYSTAFGLRSTAYGEASTAFGKQCAANSNFSTAFGNFNFANGVTSTAFGDSTSANGKTATSFGESNVSNGDISTTFGFSNTTFSYGETVLGIGATTYTPSVNGATQFRAVNATDRLLVVGNAIDANSNNVVDAAERSDALVILKNGNTGIGNSAPEERLHVVGKIRMVDGNEAIGNVMVSDVNGTATWTTPGASTAGTLDQSYDFGGAGAGRTITADAGAVTIAGTDGLVVNGNSGLGVATPVSRLQLQTASNATKTTFTQGLPSAGLIITTDYIPDNYTPGIFWSTTNNSVTKPKAGVYLRETALGTNMIFGTSNSYVNGITNDGIVIDPSGNVGIGTTAPGGQLQLSLDQGRKPGTNTWTIVSDQRLKTINGSYTKGLNEILQLNPIRFNYKNNGERTFEKEVLDTEFAGFIAQEVQPLFPDAVGTDKDGFLNFNIHPILIASVNALKELNEKNTSLREENEALKQAVEEMRQQIELIKSEIEKLKQ